MAALVAGVAGMAGAVAGGVGAVIGARVGANKAIRAVELQVRGQADAEHRHWIRQQRQVVLMEALDRIYEIHAAFGQARADYQVGRPVEVDRFDRLQQDLDAFARLVGRLGVWGLQELREVGRELHSKAAATYRALIVWHEARKAGLDDETPSVAFWDLRGELLDPLNTFIVLSNEAICEAPAG
ncbi:hypothetical protein ACFXPY_36685 [Streptomyces sp. NPDC059153]|uniref:hypothetical protein n=1 Tax=Streptomyces sp. NPDC059153 TaxID=3346743 RepID=UPI003691DE6F